MGNRQNIIAISNDLNSIRTTKWPKVYDTIFFGLLSCFYKEGEIQPKVEIEKKELIELANYRLRSNKEFGEVLDELWNTIKVIDVIDKKKVNNKNTRKARILFSGFDSEWTDDFSDMTLTVTLNSEAKELMMQKSGWTKIDFNEYKSIKSMYARALYRKCCEWSTLGKVTFRAEELIDWLELPPSLHTPRNLYGRVFNKFVEECSPYFDKLKVTTRKSKDKTSVAEAYVITFKPKFVGTWIDGKYAEQANNEQIHKARARQQELNNDYEQLTPQQKHELVELNDWLYKHEKEYKEPVTVEEAKAAQLRFNELINRYSDLSPSELKEFEALEEWTSKNEYSY